ncbi:peptidyl-prolyl cis-trans isomerase [Polyplosphaeria fusca]|uniref:peptidylprolyl isomerase n=1 Tax=Polyplosphaeria fusca TaxID=682080 RepID=A0A9P4QQ62_9PLEO|nr:peptidyl-prolyl cis-trans isomerase [Polyplosphaeria fusca]
MGVTKNIISAGNGTLFPKNGDEVSMEYTGWLFDSSAADNKGKQFDSSVGRGDLRTQIGTGRVIKGWDEGILGNDSTGAMSLGEKATLTITPDFGYGPRGFPGHIPANATLVFDVELKAINSNKSG